MFSIHSPQANILAGGWGPALTTHFSITLPYSNENYSLNLLKNGSAKGSFCIFHMNNDCIINFLNTV